MTVDLLFVVIVIVVAMLIGLSKGGLGAALAVLVTPMLSQVMPIRTAISLGLPMLILADLFAVAFYWRKWDARYLRLLLPAAIVGIVIGTALLAVLPDTTLRILLGLFTLFFVAYRVLGNRLFKAADYQPRGWHGALAGGASGFGSALANVGAPPYTAYMLLQNLDPITFVGTTTYFFAMVNAIKLPGLAIAGLFDPSALLAVWWVLPVIPFGVWLGRWGVKRINKVVFEYVILAVLVLAALVLLFVPPR